MVIYMKEQKIKFDSHVNIGENIRRIRKENNIGQTELVRLMQLEGVTITRESLVKIERGIQHISASQLKSIKIILNTTFDEILK